MTTSPQRRLTIGRPGTADIPVHDDEYVSNLHAQVNWDSTGLITVEDLGSLNGTWVNGIRIYGPTILRAGDRLRVGRTEVVLP